MTASTLSWQELLELHVLRKLAKIINRRWNVGLGYVPADGSAAQPPRTNEFARVRGLCSVVQSTADGRDACTRTAVEIERLFADQRRRGELEAAALTYTCHAGLQEIAFPVVLEGQLTGCLLAGGLIAAEEAQKTIREIDARTASLLLPSAEYLLARERHPWVPWHEISYLNELIELCAEEIVAFKTELRRRELRVDELERELGDHYGQRAIVGKSRPMQDVYRMIHKVAATDSTILIQGENGTGKELVARAIHYNSPRRGRRFV
ncbi:MAG: PocR ligand-binding domain-containing protein, partial [Pseudomonadota bacterium]